MQSAITFNKLQSVMQLQARLIAALILRETRATFGTSHIGYLWAIITPVAGISLLVMVFSMAGRHPPFGSSLALFFASGIIQLQLITRLGNGIMTALEANRALLSYPPIKRTDVLFARSILIILTFLLIATVIFGGLILLGFASVPAHPQEVLAAFFAASLLGAGLGMINAFLLTLWESWRRVEAIITKPLFFISGIFFVPDYMPPQMISWLEWNPVLHAVEWIRHGFYADYGSMVLDKAYLLSVAALLIAFGLAGERLTRKLDRP